MYSRAIASTIYSCLGLFFVRVMHVYKDGMKSTIGSHMGMWYICIWKNKIKLYEYYILDTGKIPSSGCAKKGSPKGKKCNIRSLR